MWCNNKTSSGGDGQAAAHNNKKQQLYGRISKIRMCLKSECDSLWERKAMTGENNVLFFESRAIGLGSYVVKRGETINDYGNNSPSS